MNDSPMWEYRRLAYRPAEGDAPRSSADIDQFLDVVEQLDSIDRDGWRLVSVNYDDTDGGMRFNVVLKRPLADALAGDPAETESGTDTLPLRRPSRRAA